jgi:hypothetical protein
VLLVVDVTIAVSPAVFELHAGGEPFDSSCTVYTPSFGSGAADNVVGDPGPASPHPAFPTSAIPHNEVSPANAANFMTASSDKRSGAYTRGMLGVYSHLFTPTLLLAKAKAPGQSEDWTARSESVRQIWGRGSSPIDHTTSNGSSVHRSNTGLPANPRHV